MMAQNAIVSGTIRGTISDETNAWIPSASVRIVNIDTGSELFCKTNSRGGYVFSAVPVATYSVLIEKPGFNQVRMDNVHVEVGQTTTEDVKLRVGADNQTVVVTPESSLRQESSISSVVNQSFLDGLPLSGRRYADFAQLTPNTSQDGQTGLVTIGGEQGGEDTGYANGNGANSFTLDGANATSTYFGNARGGEKIPYTFGENAIQEFQVTVSPYNAAFGGAATGFLNTVTKSGNDSFHGNTFYYNRNSATGANNAINKASGLPRPLDILQQFGGGVGGPLVTHKAWFFFDYEQQRHKEPISSVNSNFNVDETAFGVPAETPLPIPNAPLPAPGNDSTSDPTNPVYLQQVSNALNALDSNLGTHSRYANDLSFFNKYDYQPTVNDRLYLSLNLNRFDSPNGFITSTVTSQFGSSALASAFVRDYQAGSGWTHTFSPSTLSDLHFSFTRDQQYSTPSGILPPALPAIIFSSPETFELGNAGFANGRTNETQWQVAERIDYTHGPHTFKFGFETNQSHITDVSFGGFDPDAARQNGTFGGAFGFSSFSNFALGNYDSYSQSGGNPKFTFDVPYYAFYVQDAYQLSPRLTLDLGLREDFQIYPEPVANPAFPLTGQFPNEYNRMAPRFGFAFKATDKTTIRGGFGQFYENFNGLNYRNSVISNGLASQQSSVFTIPNGNLAPNAQTPSLIDGVAYGPTFPNTIANDASLFQASPNISLVSPGFKFPYVLQSSLQIETEIAPETTISIGTMWTHGVHLISGSAYDLNLMLPTGSTTYVICSPTAAVVPCTGRQVVLPNLDAGLQQEGLITQNVQQINALISPGINNYNSLFVQAQRRLHRGLQFSLSYTYAKNMTNNGVDFNNQFNFSNTSAPYLIDQRHHLSVAAVYVPTMARGGLPGWAHMALSDWTWSTVMQFASGRPYAALLDSTCTSVPDQNGLLSIGSCSQAGDNPVNDTAVNQATSNSALGINGSAPSPGEGLNSFYGPWLEQVDLGLSRTIHFSERNAITLQAQAFNLFNHANYYVQNGAGVNQFQYSPNGPNCGDGQTVNQTCYLIPETGPGGFGTLQSINALNPPRVLQVAFAYRF
jgi:outer membrane receptor protein involved in Fe transport